VQLVVSPGCAVNFWFQRKGVVLSVLLHWLLLNERRLRILPVQLFKTTKLVQ